MRRRLRIEELPAGPPFVLRDVHREVALAEQVAGALLTADRDRDPDARRHEQLVIAHHAPVRAGTSITPLGDPDRDVGIRAGCASSRLNSSPPKRATTSFGPHARLQPVGDRHEQAVADVVAERVVHELEAVDVEEQHRDVPAVGRRVEQRLLEPLEELPAVRQAGERVVVRLERRAAPARRGAR